MIKKLYSMLRKNDKIFLLLLIAFSIFIALVEMIGVTAIMPFLSVASDFSLIHSNKYYSFFYENLGFSEEYTFVILMGILLIVFYLFRGIMNMTYFYFLARFSSGRYHLFSYRLMENYLGMKYNDFTSKNSSELTKTIVSEGSNLTSIMSNCLIILSEVFVVVLIYAFMFYVDFMITLVITIFLLLNVLLIIKKITKKMKSEGVVREKFEKDFFKIISSTFGNFKIVKLLSNDRIILDEFEKISSGYALSKIKTQTLNHVPRLLVESIGFIMVISMMVYLLYKNDGDISASIATISMFVLGLYRLMPSANRIISSYNLIQYNYRALEIIHDDIMYDGENLGGEKLRFNKQVELRNISFGYTKDKLVLESLDVLIKKGEKIAFIGPSGSGKSTLIDILIGLYKPINGNIIIDDSIIDESNIKSLRKKVGYIPQNVYLFDGTVAQNISFGQEYNEQRVINVLKQAKIYDFLKEHQNGINTIVGEGGIMLSGGQKQRIAIARALYSEPEILVLDEATSALDEKIEKTIMDEIYKVSDEKTLIVIAHRLSTIDRCDTVYKIENRNIKKVR